MNLIKLIFFLVIFINFNIHAETNRIIIATTTSTYDSGLLKYINTFFEKKNNIKVHPISVGTGQAIRIASNGDADILLVHHKESEIEFIKNGYGIKRFQLMYNDFLIVGPKNDKDNCKSIEKKLNYIKNNKLVFISRGDDSGTHKKEKELWENNDLNPSNFEFWYIENGQGMGSTLLMTNEKRAYTLTDRATWITFKKRENLKIICENQPPLLNQYSIIAVNPKINKNINYEGATKYIRWILSAEGKNLINNYKVKDTQLFFFNYK
ncbi:MAG: Tungstate-binding protein TupA [Alphaproteobacteria bacterium MarineAlpha5_Bin8]|nr:MAG: Tungstate-binding protein TupA [Alphaproteobacteria bacterium MarineAlpha5_Bin8]PPR45202.1 MAG: Tungstate-binding protein TupA [Alphaproteobacteria bacterium MarineAlpha5_Bin7]PPR53051.1 MAG: Tungstate-binding protein TupA [Alphaproteobacteria bacterium MarineAlpha5_Bin6]|tara:strand:+ start:107 stop:904 length:798 start_codon:yes stop_codon:yes gene_type:complete